MTYSPFEEDQKTAFGEVLTAEPTPVVQLQFPYNINTLILDARDNNGTSSIVNNKLQVSTGAGTNQSSQVLSKAAVKYNPGQGALARFTAVFTTGAANSTQYIGIGDASDGFFFGYNGTAFGIMRRQGGSPEVRTLTVTAASLNTESIEITLDGDSTGAAVSVTDQSADNASTRTLTANEIADHDFSNVGQGWATHSMGANVIFESYNAASQTGTYEITTATSAAGTFAQSVAGAAPTETIVAQTSWSEDKFDGTGDSGVTLDPTKGNVYQIRYQWLGFGLISFFIEDPADGDYHVVHRIEYANANTIPSVNNPTLPLSIFAGNTSNTTDIKLQTSSMAGFVEGRDTGAGLFNTATVEATGIGTDETPILSIHNHTIYQSVLNRVRLKFTLFIGSIDAVTANKPSTLRIRLNPALTGASFSAIDANTSVVRTDTSATAVSGGRLEFAQIITEGSAAVIDFSTLNVFLNVGDTITVSLESLSGNADTVVAVNWLELF